jgi:hypothetical protein
MFSNAVRILVVLSSKNLKPESDALLTSCHPPVCIEALAAPAGQKTAIKEWGAGILKIL